MPGRIGRPAAPKKSAKTTKGSMTGTAQLLYPVNFVREWRLARGFTGQDLADKLLTTKATISRIENRKQGITPDVGRLLGEALNTKHSTLLERGPTPEEIGRPPATAGAAPFGRRRDH